MSRGDLDRLEKQADKDIKVQQEMAQNPAPGEEQLQTPVYAGGPPSWKGAWQKRTWGSWWAPG